MNKGFWPYKFEWICAVILLLLLLAGWGYYVYKDTAQGVDRVPAEFRVTQ